MKTTHLIALLLAAVGCGSEVTSTSAPPAPVIEESCSETLCLDEDVEGSLAETEDALATCVPSDDVSLGDPAGLRISDVAIVGIEGSAVSLRVVLANTLPDGVMSYPGTRLRVVSGNGAVLDGGAGQLYGIFGCDETETVYTVDWDGQAPLVLAASATNDLGESTIHEVELTLQP